MAKQAKDEKSKGKKGDKGKDGKKGKKGTAAGPSIATHPRAGVQVRRAKGLGGLGGFVIAGLLSLQAGVPMFDVALRALVAGVIAYVLAWACSVTIWRHLVLAELRTLVENGQLTPAAPEPGARGKDDDRA